MIFNLNKIYQSKFHNIHKLRLILIGLFFFNDLLIITYLKIKANTINKDIKQLIPYFKTVYNISSDQFTYIKDDIVNLYLKTLSITVILFIVYHLSVYFFFLKKKHWTYSYLKILSISAIPLTSLFIFSLIAEQSYKMIWLGILIPTYLFCYLGLIYKKDELLKNN